MYKIIFNNFFFKIFIAWHAYNIKQDPYLNKKYNSFFLENKNLTNNNYDFIFNHRKFKMLSKKDKKNIKKDILDRIDFHIYRKK